MGKKVFFSPESRTFYPKKKEKLDIEKHANNIKIHARMT